MHGKLEVIAGFASFSIPLLWEDSVLFSALQVDAVTKSKGELMAERRDPNLQEEDGVILRALVRVDEGSSGLGDSAAAKGDGDVGVVPWKIKFNPIQKGWKGQASEALPKDAFTVNETPVVGKSALVPKCLTLDLGVEKPRCKEGES